MIRLARILFCVAAVSCTWANDVHFTGVLPEPAEGAAGQSLQVETVLPRAGRIWALDWSPDGTYIAVGSRAGQVRVYGSRSLELVAILPGLKGDVNGVHWSPDSRQIAASGSWQDPRVVVWDFKTGVMRTVGTHGAQVRDVKWSPDGRFLASGSHDGKLSVWAADGTVRATFKGSNGGYVGIDWMDDDQLVAAAWDNTVRRYSLTGGDGPVFANGELGKKAMLSVDAHPSGDRIASGDYGNDHDPEHLVKLWSARGELLKILRGHEREVRALAWSPDGSTLATGGESVRLWDKDGEPVAVFEHEGGPLWSLDWSPGGDRLATGDNDGNLILWDASGKRLADRSAHSSTLLSTGSPAGSSKMLLGFSDGQVRLYDPVSGAATTYQPHTRGVGDIAWSPDGGLVALASNDGTGSIWKLDRARLKRVAVLEGHPSGVRSVAWSPDGRHLATGSYQSPIFVWDAQGAKVDEHATAVDLVDGIEWQDGVPVAAETRQPLFGVAGVPVEREGERLLLVPLADNRFALFDAAGQLVEGDPEDFVRVERSDHGSVSVRSYDEER